MKEESIRCLLPNTGGLLRYNYGKKILFSKKKTTGYSIRRVSCITTYVWSSACKAYLIYG